MRIVSIVYRRPDLAELQKAAVAEYYPEAQHLLAVTPGGCVKADIQVPAKVGPKENILPRAYFNALEHVMEAFPTGDLMVMEADVLPIATPPPELIESGFCPGDGPSYWPTPVYMPAGKRARIRGNLMGSRDGGSLSILTRVSTVRMVSFVEYIGNDLGEFFIHLRGGDGSVSKPEMVAARKKIYTDLSTRYGVTA